MKKIIYTFLFFIVVYFVILPHVRSLQAAVQTYVIVNGEMTKPNILINANAVRGFVIPKETVERTYPSNTPITFDLKPETLPLQGENIVIRWSFGDGVRPIEGNHIAHSFDKPGSFIAIVELNDRKNGFTYIPLTSFLIHIVPSESYVLPQAYFRVNSVPVDTTRLTTVTVKSDKPTTFDSGGSTGNDVTYHWDFGDTIGSEIPSISHTYKKKIPSPVYVVLRVIDKNGLFRDAYVALDITDEEPFFVFRILQQVGDFLYGLLKVKNN